MSCVNLSASLQHFSVPFYLPKRQECPLFLPTRLLCSCFLFFRASFQSSPFPGIFKFSTLAASSLSRNTFRFLSSSKAHSLFCYTYIICSVKQRSFTANPFESSDSLLPLPQHSLMKTLTAWPLPLSSKEITCSGSLVFCKAPNPQRFLSYYPPESLHST